MPHKKIFAILRVRGIFALTFLGAIISAISIALPYISGKFIDALVERKGIFLILFLLIFCSFILVFLKRFYEVFAAYLAKNKQIELQKNYIEKIVSLSPFELEKFPNGELGMKFFRDIQNVVDVIKNFYPQLIEIFCSVIFATALIFYSNWVVGIGFLLIVPINLFCVLPYTKLFERINSISRKSADKVFCRIFEIFYSLPFLKSISAENFYREEAQTKLASLAKIACKNGNITASFNFSIGIFLAVGESVILGVSAFLAYKNLIKVGDVIFYQLLFISTFNSFSSVFRLSPILSTIMESLKSLEELDCKACELSGKGNFDFSGEVELVDASFTYSGALNPILKNFSIKIEHGDFVKIEGRNGTGKTTLLKILSGYAKLDSGDIFFDGNNLKDVNLTQLRSNISIVNQDFLLISDTLKNNITLHNKNYTKDDIDCVVNLVGLKTLVNSSANGLDEFVGNNGKKLSGGEMQKIAIARALIRKPKMIIFDEITNHLDKNSQEVISGIVEKLRGQVTMLFVSHDINLNLKFDKIIKL